MKKLFEALVELKPGLDDELFDSRDVLGGFIKVYAYCECQSEFIKTIKKSIKSYGSFFVGVEDIKESTEPIDELNEWMGLYYSDLHTF